jgi:hypothetical protein
VPHWLAVNFVIFVLGVSAGVQSALVSEAFRRNDDRSVLEHAVLCAASLTACATTILWL